MDHIKLELNSTNWGVIDHNRFIEWIDSLPQSTSVVMQKRTNNTKYLIYVLDKHSCKHLALDCLLSEFKTIQMTRYINRKIIGSTVYKVQEEDLSFMENWLVNQIQQHISNTNTL